MTDDLVGRLRRDSLKYQTDTFEEAAARIETLEAEKAEWLGIMRHLAEGRGRDLARAIIAKEDGNVRP